MPHALRFLEGKERSADLSPARLACGEHPRFRVSEWGLWSDGATESQAHTFGEKPGLAILHPRHEEGAADFTVPRCRRSSRRAGNALQGSRKALVFFGYSKVSDSAAAAGAALAQDARADDGVGGVDEDGADDADAAEGDVDVLELGDGLAVIDGAEVVAVEGHVGEVGADGLGAGGHAVVVERLLHDAARLGQDAVRVRVATVVVDAVEDVVAQVVGGAALERAVAPAAGGRARAGQAAERGVHEGADVLPQGGDDRVQVDRVERVVDHQDQVLQSRFEHHVRGHVLDLQAHAVDGEVDAGVELEQLEHRGLEVDFRRQVRDRDVDFLDRYRCVEVDVWGEGRGAGVGGRVGGAIHGGVRRPGVGEGVARVSVGGGLRCSEGGEEGEGQKEKTVGLRKHHVSREVKVVGWEYGGEQDGGQERLCGCRRSAGGCRWQRSRSERSRTTTQRVKQTNRHSW